ncbi:hypothetical protein [Streptomyces corynorhini]|nr:hypothetical protein [Streptomyces corynorhini]
MSTSQPRLSQRTMLLGCTALCSLLLVSCTSGQDNRPKGAASSASSSAHAPSQQRTEKKLAAEARTAVDGTAVEEKLVESGVERVPDGVRSEPFLHEKDEYRLTVACAGDGDVRITFTPAVGIATKSLPCDRSVVSERFVAPGSVRLDITGGQGASGMIAWRISKI